jgi:hypothetical protein
MRSSQLLAVAYNSRQAGLAEILRLLGLHQEE